MDANIEEQLRAVRTVAIIGCSANKYRTSYHIANYLKENGIRIIPINPNYDEVLGVDCYSSLSEVPGDRKVDVVDIFRDSEFTADMVREIIDWSEQAGQKPMIWTQLSVSSQEAKSLAEEAGFDYVENECMMVQHDRVTD
ncbi:MAG: CoA-binding protein [Fodinibius sp.]|nr:CoA-binding protein [Fodinibius sp.]